MDNNNIKTNVAVMDTLLLSAVGQIGVAKIAKPKPDLHEVLIKVAACGVCGSDIPRIFVKGTYSFPTVCGHELSGTVETYSQNVKKFISGDRVTIFPLIWCGACKACKEGKYAQCSNYNFLGSRCNGGFAEFVVVPEKNLIKIPDNVTLDEAAMTEPAAVALHAVRRAGKDFSGQTVTIFGAGPIGLIAAQWARVFNADKVLIFDIVAEKLSLARKLGFEHVYNALEIDPSEVIASITDNEGSHVCIEAAGVPETFRKALASTRRNGRMVILGNPSGDITLPAELISRLMRQEIAIWGSWNSDYSFTDCKDDWHCALEAISQKRISVESLISHRVKLQDGPEVLRKMRDNQGSFCKVLMQP